MLLLPEQAHVEQPINSRFLIAMGTGDFCHSEAVSPRGGRDFVGRLDRHTAAADAYRGRMDGTPAALDVIAARLAAAPADCPRSAHGLIAAQGGPLLPAKREDRDDGRHRDLRGEGRDRNPDRRVVGAEALPEHGHPVALAATAAMRLVERREELREHGEHAPADRQDRCSEQGLGRDQERHREHALVGRADAGRDDQADRRKPRGLSLMAT